MARVARIKPKESVVYHLVSRTVGQDFYLGDVEKDQFVRLLKDLNTRYFINIYTFCLMSNHFHIVARVEAADAVSDEAVRARLAKWRGGPFAGVAANVVKYKAKWTDVSEFMKELKQTFSRWYNRRKRRTGYLWGDRFKSVILGDDRAVKATYVLGQPAYVRGKSQS